MANNKNRLDEDYKIRQIKAGKSGDPESITQIEIQLIDYESSGNPIHIWYAYKVARESGEEIPEWILQYFERAANNLYSLAFPGPPPKDPSAAIAEALEMKKPGRSGRGNVFADFFRKDHFEMMVDVHDCLSHGDKLYIALENAAEKHNKSVATVRRAWEKYGYFFRTTWKIES